MSSLQFLNKKSWHVKTRKNEEKVWLREQAAEKEAARLAELQKQLLEERKLEEIRRLELESGKAIVPVGTPKIDWMYEGPGTASSQAVTVAEQEAFLLGQKEATLLAADGQVERKDPSGSHSHGLPHAVTAYGDPATDAGVDLFTLRDAEAKLREDPLLAIRRQEMQAVKRAVSLRARMGDRPVAHQKPQVPKRPPSPSEDIRMAAKRARKEERERIREDRRARRAHREARRSVGSSGDTFNRVQHNGAGTHIEGSNRKASPSSSEMESHIPKNSSIMRNVSQPPNEYANITPVHKRCETVSFRGAESRTQPPMVESTPDFSGDNPFERQVDTNNCIPAAVAREHIGRMSCTRSVIAPHRVNLRSPVECDSLGCDSAVVIDNRVPFTSSQGNFYNSSQAIKETQDYVTSLNGVDQACTSSGIQLGASVQATRQSKRRDCAASPSRKCPAVPVRKSRFSKPEDHIRDHLSKIEQDQRIAEMQEDAVALDERRNARVRDFIAEEKAAQLEKGKRIANGQESLGPEFLQNFSLNALKRLENDQSRLRVGRHGGGVLHED